MDRSLLFTAEDALSLQVIVNAAFAVVDADGDPSEAIAILRAALDNHFPDDM